MLQTRLSCLEQYCLSNERWGWKSAWVLACLRSCCIWIEFLPWGTLGWEAIAVANISVKTPQPGLASLSLLSSSVHVRSVSHCTAMTHVRTVLLKKGFPVWQITEVRKRAYYIFILQKHMRPLFTPWNGVKHVYYECTRFIWHLVDCLTLIPADRNDRAWNS